MRACWNCRRRRLKCDGASPHCTKCQAMGTNCLGYDDLLTWVGGIASRGHMTGKTFKEPLPHPRRSNGARQVLRYVSRGIGPDGGLLAVRNHPVITLNQPSAAVVRGPSIPRLLTEPIFQDLNYDARELIVYYDQNICSRIMMIDGVWNPYRDLIPLVSQSKSVENAIMTVAACHIAHSQVGYPIVKPAAGNMCDYSTSQMINRSLIYKQRTLRYLSKALADFCQDTRTCILATIVILMLLELYEGGAGSWTIHLEGAKKLLDVEASASNLATPRIVQKILHELVIFDIFGSTFVQRGSLTQPLTARLAANSGDELSSISALGCPRQILTAIETVALQWHTWVDYEPATVLTARQPPIELVSSTLKQITEFDVSRWRDDVLAASTTQFPFSWEHMTHLCHAWKLSAEIYTSHILRQLTRNACSTFILAEQLIAALKHLESGSNVIRFLLWPLFIAGAECTLPQHREWILSILDKIWNITLFATAKTATHVLIKLWAKIDSAEQQSCHQMESWDWMNELSSMGTSWLFL